MSAKTPDAVCVRQVIEVHALRGRGVEDDLYRIVIQYWSFKGELLAERDPFIESGGTTK